MDNIEKLEPRAFTKFCMSIGMVPSSYTTALTYEEQLLWFCSYLEKEVIPAVNNNAEAVTELQKLYIQLKQYVDDYFDNLDIQEEINNKLDAMADDGTLAAIIAQYVQLQGIMAYNSVADLKAAENLIDGSFVQTYGYYNYGDGGASKYKVREVTNQDTEDDATIIALHDENLVAELIVNDSTIPVEVFGAKGDGSTDDTQAIQKAINYCTLHNLTCFFNNKVYITTSPLEIKEVSVLSGGVTNDEYNTQARIKNTTTNMINLTSNVVGAKIKNLCFVSDSTKQLYFLQEDTYALEWCEISNCGFREFYKVFDCYTLGCRFEKLWINYGHTMGTLHGSDNTMKDCWIGSPLATASEDLLYLDGYGLSRLENLYFTGKVDNNTGCGNILKVDGYSSNLQFDGCYFDFSNGSAITILGKGNDVPKSMATNLSFNNCLFRGNCCDQNTTTHIINADYCRNLNIINCSFMEQDRYTVNANSKIYNMGQYSQGVMLLNNYYETPYSANGAYINNACMIEPYAPAKFNKLGFDDYDNTTFLKNVGVTRKIFHKKQSVTTGATYGEATVNFAESMGDSPVVSVMVENSNYICTINQVTSTYVQVIVRRATDGSAITGSNVTLDVIAING